MGEWRVESEVLGLTACASRIDYCHLWDDSCVSLWKFDWGVEGDAGVLCGIYMVSALRKWHVAVNSGLFDVWGST